MSLLTTLRAHSRLLSQLTLAAGLATVLVVLSGAFPRDVQLDLQLDAGLASVELSCLDPEGDVVAGLRMRRPGARERMALELSPGRYVLVALTEHAEGGIIDRSERPFDVQSSATIRIDLRAPR